MARDYSPKIRQQKQLQLKYGRRASYDRILIVSEGSKTEPNYFREIRKAHRLHTANVEVQPCELGTAPVQVVNYARMLFENGDGRKKIQRHAFEKIYAVFDRDHHRSYYDALRLAESFDGKLKNDIKQTVTFKAIASVPCFELWLLLHFEDIQAPLHRDDAIRRLKLHIPDYEKGACNSFQNTKGHLSIASERAEKLAARFTADTDPQPFTGIAELVKLLITLQN